MSDSPDDPPELGRILSSKDWIARFFCDNCQERHYMLLLKQRTRYKALLVANGKAHQALKNTPFGVYKDFGGAPDDKVIDDIEDHFGPEPDEDDEEEEDADDDVQD